MDTVTQFQPLSQCSEISHLLEKGLDLCHAVAKLAVVVESVLVSTVAASAAAKGVAQLQKRIYSPGRGFH